MIDLVKERLDFAKSLGVRYTINLREEDLVEKVSGIHERPYGRVCDGKPPAQTPRFAQRWTSSAMPDASR